MQLDEFSELILKLTASATETGPAEHQAQLVDLVKAVVRFDAAWWGWSSFANGRITLVNSTSHNLPRSFESAVRAVSSIDPFIRHGRNLPVFSKALVPDREPVAPEFRAFAEAYGIGAMLNGHCRLDGSSAFNFFMSLYRHDPRQPFSEDEARSFRIILRHLEQSLSLSLRTDVRARAPRGGEAAIVDRDGEIVRASRGFLAALGLEGMGSRAQSNLLRRLSTPGLRHSGRAVVLASEAYAPELALVRLARPSRWDQLTAREREVAALYLSGLTMRQIATANRVSANTVRNQIAAIYRKTECDGKLALMRALAPDL